MGSQDLSRTHRLSKLASRFFCFVVGRGGWIEICLVVVDGVSLSGCACVLPVVFLPFIIIGSTGVSLSNQPCQNGVAIGMIFSKVEERHDIGLSPT
jgi:hypothetical protein